MRRTDDRNAKIAPGLVKILTDAQIEVPDFLLSFTGMGGGGAGDFGGSDIRGGPVTQMAEDEWWTVSPFQRNKF